MLKVWSIVRKKQKMAKDIVVECEHTGEEGLLEALKLVCKKFDLPMPVVLGKHTREYTEFFRTRFSPDDFIEDFPFDALEIEQLREAKKPSERNPLYD